MKTEEKLKIIYEDLKSKPREITTFQWVYDKGTDFFPSQIGITKEEYEKTLSITAYKKRRATKQMIYPKLRKLIKKYSAV